MRISFRLSSTCAFVAVLVVTGWVGVERSDANPTNRSNFFTAYPQAVGTRLDDLPSNGGHCGVCHYNFNGGGTRNLYGQAIQALPDRLPATMLTIGSVDSDGDTYTNDQEILDLASFSNTPTFPGLTPDNVGSVSNVDLADIQDHLVPQPDQAVPTVSTWGLVAMTLLMLTAGTVVFCRRRALWNNC
jgi:hypothetical protein